MSTATLTQEETHVLTLLATHTYEQVQAQIGWSKGRIYGLALRHGARKMEDRIRERHEERRQRQLESLRTLIDSTAKADVLDFLDSLPDESVKMHFTSPPYNLGKRYGDAPRADNRRATSYHGWMMQILSEMARTLQKGGVLCLNLGKTRDWQGKLMPLAVLLYKDLCECGLTCQSDIARLIPHGLVPSNRVADRHDTILVFSKGRQATFNPTAARVPQKQPGKRAFKGPNKGMLSGHPLGAWPTDVWSDIGHVGHNHPDAAQGRHPAQFPVKLAKRAVLLYTMAGDLVCDPFSGSGSTAIACIETGRHFVGADLFYEELRARRLRCACMDRVSMLPGVTDESVAMWRAQARRVEHQATPITQQQEQAICDQMGLFDTAAAA